MKGKKLNKLLLITATLSAISMCVFAGVYEDQLADIHKIKQRMADTWRVSDTSLDSAVAKLLAVEKGWWSEFNLDHPGINHDGAAFTPALILARAYASPGSAYHESAEVLASLEDGLKHLKTMVYPGCKRVRNWWSWDIGMPMKLLPMLYLVEGSLNAELYDAYVETVIYLLLESVFRYYALPGYEKELQAEGPYQPSAEPFVGKTDTNALWIDHRRLQLAVLIENLAMAGKWSAHSFGEVGKPGEGCLQADYSYKFHGAIPMWAYGRAFLSDYGTMVKTYQGTYLGPTEAQLLRYGAMAEHFVQGFLYRGRICPAMIGREITRGPAAYVSAGGFAAVDTLAISEHPDADRFAALAAREAQYLARTPHRTDVEPAPPSIGVFAYPDSDFLQVTRENWAVGIKMHSKRNKGYESINYENLQGWFLSHGSMFYFLDGNEWYNCWPTLDWTRLPGTTVASTKLVNNTDVGNRRKQNESPFVGMIHVSDDAALAVEELRIGDFHARKLWLMNGDVILCVGRDIAGPWRVETTVVNLPIALDAEVLVDGLALPTEPFERDIEASWLWAGDVGYVFLDPTKLHLVRETRQSDWRSIRGNPKDSVGGEKGNVETKDYFTAVISHDGDTPAYAYAFCPRRGSAEMPALARSVRDAYILEATPQAMRIAYPEGAAYAFWEPGTLRDMEVDRSSLIVLQGQDLHAADPAWRGGEFTVKVNGKALEPISSARGRTVTMKLSAQ